MAPKAKFTRAQLQEAALALLREETGAAFDARCVSALERVLLGEQPERSVIPLRLAAASG